MRSALLRGPDHPQLGSVASATAGPSAAAALTAGAVPKDPPPVEPNEDAALAAVLDASPFPQVVLAVCDGAGGFGMAQAALDVITHGLEEVGEGREGLARVWTRVGEALSATRRAWPVGTRPAHTAVTLAVVRDGEVQAMTRGDTALLLVRAGRVRLVSGVAPYLDHAAVLPLPQRAALDPGDVLVLASDGLFEALGPDWPGIVASAAMAETSAAARDLVTRALAAGAPDNVAVAVARPAP